ncbi:WAT1-related protein At5g64700-like isoform X3 [Prosopis cineraria]|uniref:WAT1-related protein At5g64700-like isoform X3 n=2 Tax=Prosopis cineraria TaxID=364024 RepID=UPI00240F8674|nr:WAT1-related protein At5g64700-like isoform X3 [Prosopis cineraria]
MGEYKPYLAMVLIQLIYSGMILLSKAVFNEGMNSSVFIFYRQLVGTIILVPLAFIFERKSAVPLSFAISCKIFLLSFFGVALCLNVYAIALVYTSATLGAAVVSSLPVFTFFFAVLLRMEKVKVRTKLGVIKIAGLVVCLCGVATLALYKGPQVWPFHTVLSADHSTQHPHHDHSSSPKRWYLGSLLLFCAIITWSIWLVLQARFLISYPSKLKFTSLQCLLSAVQSFGIAIASERDMKEWKLGWNMRLLAVLYCGTMVTGITYYLQAWAIEKKGPLFPALWNPLNFMITIIGSMFLLNESINLGRYLWREFGISYLSATVIANRGKF